MSNTLTKDMRNRICKALLDHRFGAERAKAKAVRDAFGDYLYDGLYTPEQVKHMQALPRGFFKAVTHTTCYFAGQHDTFGFSEQRVISYSHYSRDLRFAADDPQTVAHNALVKAEATLKCAENEARTKAMAILGKATTIKKLVEMWPEILPFIPTNEAAVHLPAIPVAEVNAVFGLPKAA